MTSIIDRSLRSYFHGTSIRTITGTLGLVVTVVLIALLCEREVLSMAFAGRRRQRLAAVEAILLPLVVAFVVIVVIRFRRLSI
jgi:hypothetical protein